ncbi:ABC transporter substrate-binding protein [Hyphomicrobium sp.]|uniref:ABC transporter substrate-binding protein n=1 Tax=Hyphomicrobium sp. TaxID=82 RepID=UPI0025BF07D1|nr:ABC transporter substrate-binding protein [Hyphomicrobium sp.]
MGQVKFAGLSLSNAGIGPVLRRIAAAIVTLLMLTIGPSVPAAVKTTDDAEAAQRPPVIMPIFFTSKSDDCYDSGIVTAIKRIATLSQNYVNRTGGIAGRQLLINLLDDKRDPQRATANLATAIGDPQTIAMAGFTSSNRAKTAFDANGKDLKAANIPFISDISVAKIIADYPSVFTTRPSEDEERMPVIAEFVKEMKFERVAFVGLQDNVASGNLGDALKRVLAPNAIIADHRLVLKDDKLDPAAISAMTDDLKAKNADIVFIAIGNDRRNDVLNQFKSAGFTPPVFVNGRIDNLVSKSGGAMYPNDVYQLAWDGFPDVYSERLRDLLLTSIHPEYWVFQGEKNDAAPGWKDGTCKVRDDDVPPNPLDDENMRALQTGMRYADMIRLVAEAARSAPAAASVPDLREFIVNELNTTYAAGKGMFKGRFGDWSFRPTSRAAATAPLLVVLPRGIGHPQLAPMQFLRLRNDAMRRIDTLYADIDLIRADRIDDNDQTFLADFYISMNDRSGASIDQIEFSNAYLDPGSNSRQITITPIHDGGKSDAYPDHMKIYQVTGKFLYSPNLRNYPFDTQRFSIDIQPKHGSAAFIVQPPPRNLRDKSVTVDGWDPKDQYVSYDEDFVRTVDAHTLEPSVVPFYKASFVWLMKRQTTDYFLRVVVPLAFILFIAYLSIFISTHHFEAIVTIQVTALLSAVALYLALPKLDANIETLSDRLFLFTYLVLSIIIAITIARVNRRIEPIGWLKKSLALLHIAIVPLMVGLMSYYVYQAMTA